MVYLRGNPLDYEGWAGNHMPQWSYAACLPYFKRLESADRPPDAYRGGEGPVRITLPESDNVLYRAYIEAAMQAGHAYTEDVNGYRHEGVFRLERTTHRGIRSSASRAYLHPALGRANLDLEVGALTDRVLFEGARARSVEFIQRGRARRVHADREVILSGGAFNSPQVLLRSGVGDPGDLESHGIGVVHDLPGVGRNLQDHLNLYIQYACKQPVSYYPATRPLGRLKVGLQWWLRGTGLGASNLFEAGAFFRSRPDVEFPNLQHHFFAIAIDYNDNVPVNRHAFQVDLSPMRPTSRGRSGCARATRASRPGSCSTT